MTNDTDIDTDIDTDTDDHPVEHPPYIPAPFSIWLHYGIAYDVLEALDADPVSKHYAVVLLTARDGSGDMFTTQYIDSQWTRPARASIA